MAPHSNGHQARPVSYSPDEWECRVCGIAVDGPDAILHAGEAPMVQPPPVALTLGPDPRQGRARANDKATSITGAGLVAYRSGSHKARLLAVYASGRDWTDEEAATEAGLDRSCYWKRCGELREDGLIAPVASTRVGVAGVERIVCAVTPSGIEVAKAVHDSPGQRLAPHA